MKDFDKWNKTKKELENKDISKIFFNVKEVWWCSIGINIGSEENGKNENFERPVLIIKKYNKEFFKAIPLSSIIKEDNKFYLRFNMNNIDGSLILSQARSLSSKRLIRKIIKIDKIEFLRIKEIYKNSF